MSVEYSTISIFENREEVWKPIPALAGAYEASSFGRIRNAKTLKIKYKAYDGRYLKFGYDIIVDGKHRRGWYRVHRAIAEAFLENPNKKRTVNHIDGNRFNNSVDNLEWASYKEQAEHARDVLRKGCGENNPNAKHSNIDVLEMRRLYKVGKTIRQIADMFNEKPCNIRRYVKYERWKMD